MSFYGLEGCFRDNSATSRRHKKRSVHYPGKKVTDQIIIVKTIYDPQKTLSKKKLKRFFTDHLDGFYPNVPYSLNKRRRWLTASPASLLSNQSSYLPELCVVNKKASDWHTTIYDNSTDIVTHFYLLDDDVIATLSAKGGKQSLQFYANMLREKRGLDKDEVEAAQMHYNVVSPQPVHGLESRQNRKLGRTDEEDRRAIRRKLKEESKRLYRNTDAFPDEWIQNNKEEEVPHCCEAEVPRQIVLGDFVNIDEPSTSHNPRKTPSSNATSSFEMVILKPPKMIDISSATNAPAVFEIIDIKLEKLDTFDLQKEIPLLAPGYCAVHWFGPERVSVASKRSTNPSSMFVLFFELPRNMDTLRIRINTNAQFTKLNSKAALLKLLETRKNFPTLFNDLLEFMFTLKMPPPPGSFLRFKDCKENFMRTVNSTMLATTARQADIFAQLELLRFHYNCDFKIGLESKKANTCHKCGSPKKTDLFASKNGMMCRECVASNIIHQICLNRFPLEIPLDAALSSPVDLLYAILPISVMSLLSKMSYRYFNALDYPDAHMVECPQCCMNLTINIVNLYNTCICPNCNCYFCYRCRWEPHWPLSCEEFHDWNEKWSQQYFFEKFKLDPGERLLKVKCYCNEFLYVPEFGPHFTFCKRLCQYTVERHGTYKCGGCYDQSGILRPADFGAWPYTPRFRKENHPNFEKYGDPVQPEYLEQKKLVKKFYAEICAEVRRLRFDKTRRMEYENAVKQQFTFKLEQLELIDLRKTVLFLVEHCMAWLYLHRHQRLHHLRRSVLLLLQSFMNFQAKVLDPRYYQRIQAQDVEEIMSAVIKSFRNYLINCQ